MKAIREEEAALAAGTAQPAIVEDREDWKHGPNLPLPSSVHALALKDLIWAVFPDKDGRLNSSTDGSNWSLGSLIPMQGKPCDRFVLTDDMLVFMSGPPNIGRPYEVFDADSLLYSADRSTWKWAIPVSRDSPVAPPAFFVLPRVDEILVLTWNIPSQPNAAI